MFIEVISPDSKLFAGEVKQATLQTYVWEITILPEHMPLVSIIKPWLLKVIPTNTDSYSDKTFIFTNEQLTISIGNGIAYTDGSNIKLVVQSGNLGTESSIEDLEKELEKRNNIREQALENNDTEAVENADLTIEALKSHLSLQK